MRRSAGREDATDDIRGRPSLDEIDHPNLSSMRSHNIRANDIRFAVCCISVVVAAFDEHIGLHGTNELEGGILAKQSNEVNGTKGSNERRAVLLMHDGSL